MATFEFDTTGTVNVTNGSVEVVGVDTNWVATYPGLMLNMDGLSYPIASVNSRNSITLVYPYVGATSTNKGYALVPIHPNALSSQKSINDMIAAINDLIANGGLGDGSGGTSSPGITSAVVNSAGHLIITLSDGRTLDAGLVKGADGQDGQDGQDGTGSGGEVAIQSVVDVTQFAGQVAGGKGVYMIVPVADGEPGVALTQEAEVIIPEGSTNAGVGMWVRTTASGMALVVGLSNVPLPQPENPGEDIDLSGSATFYAPLNEITPLGLNLNGTTATLTLSRAFTDSQLKIRRQVDTPIVTPTESIWYTGAAGSPYPVTGDAVASTMTLSKRGEGTTSYADGRITLNKNAYLITPKLNIEFPSSSDTLTTQTPPWIMLEFKGITPQGGAIMGRLESYGVGHVAHQKHWNNRSIEFSCHREGTSGISVISDEIRDLYDTDDLIQTKWENDENGTGGIVTFYVNGEQYGASKPTEIKPRITSDCDFQLNASVENTSNSVDNLVVEYVGIQIGKPDVSTSYNTIADGTVTLDDLQSLVVDATGVTTQQAEHVLSYTANGTEQFDLSIVVGEMVLPAGRPYKAVLMDFSTGEAVAHANELVMTKPYAQNCRFEDSTLYGAQGSWTEVGPQGDVPIIDGIRYGCEGIRQGNYVMFQFVYSLDTATEPFGDPSGLNTYMRPHKWYIYDNEGTLLQRVEMPSGQPLNSSSMKPIWEGQYDGRSVAQITSDNRWYPFGTTRCSVVYRNGNPPAYGQQFIYDHLPVYDQRVPFASHTNASVNGYDLRVYAGSAAGEGQSNGFANWKAMPWQWGAYDYQTIQDWGAASLDPYKNLYAPVAMTPNAALWLKYEPFNTMGRCPIVGPGGTRDDRQIIPEPVAQYMRDVTKTRPIDGTPLADIALSYMTGYASDPFNMVVNGKITPLYKNNPRRNIGTRSHYYGYGDAARPAEQSVYYQVGRLYEWSTGQNPLRCYVPSSGATSDRPYFGGFEIDSLHAHQFPHWGSLLWQTPEFAMFGVNFSDQCRMYGNSILADWPSSISAREQAWTFMHAVMQWKTASTNSTRLYSRADIMDWVVFDFELFYDRWYATTPGFLNPPSMLNSGGGFSGYNAIYAGCNKFGPCYYTEGVGLELSEFQAGYWLSILHAAHKLGFLDALSEQSEKCEAIVNWLKAIHRKRIVNRMNDGDLMNMAGSDYQVMYWTVDDILNAGYDVSALPQNLTQVIAAHGAAPSWDTFTDGTNVYSRDGQANDANLAGAALLLDMGMTGTDLEQAAANAEAKFQEKLASETARGYQSAGSEWFRYHQTTNNRPYKP
ncbi:hypothetical protein HT136_08485 [Novosphingobium profundi]|uniref:hypothetical protein n=1 Tax=Novosphingobium profundi TaxID=1774954 RepID=UPI001BDAB20F|nr:hypothetical protein [Novosphingobium profundi]MBT0668405.1 hypothetical protein [Novosphingobium profundi]